jgi:tRNA(adenine34) deaminase
MIKENSIEYSDQIKFFTRALECAKQAFDEDEVPIGAVVVDEKNCIIGDGYNKAAQKKSQLGHAEIIALHAAEQSKNDWRLNNCVLYSTLEPCLMCIGLAHNTRISTIIYAASSPLFGFQQFIGTKFPAMQIVQLPPEHQIAQSSIQLLKRFFQQQRERK